MALRSPHTKVTDARRWAAGLAAGLLLAPLATASPALAAVGPACPEPFPSDEVVAGQSVTGLTVTRGTVPEEFTGEVIGRLEDALMPGVDIVLTRLSSAEIERVGVWQGMSGSPVYAEDGRLIGAVAYGFSNGPSPVAGIVPGGDMLDLLSDEARGGGAARVELPRALARRLVAAGAVSARQVADGLRPIQLPLTVSTTDERTVTAIRDRMDSPWVRVMRSSAGRVAAAAEPVPVTVGGNLVATLSYGDVTASATGTATAVCGQEVVGFGHPLNGTGETRLGLHGGEAVYVQEDSLFGGFKLANVGAPLGTIDQDRHVGVAGTLGPLPTATVLTAAVTRGTESRTGRTDVYFKEFVPDLAYAHFSMNIDKALSLGAGTARGDVTISGTLRDGRRFTVRRPDVHTASQLGGTLGEELANLLWQLQGFGGAVNRVSMNTTVDRDTTRAVITGVSIRQGNRWVAVPRGKVLTLTAGTTAHLRATMQRSTGGATWQETLSVAVPARSAGAPGMLRVLGGGSSLLDTTMQATTASSLLSAYKTAPRNADVVALLDLPPFAGGRLQARSDAGLAVRLTGGLAVRVLVR